LLHPGDRVGAAVSGGIDSVALLRLLLELRNELGFVVSIVHFNHRLRGPDSAADQEFVARLAREQGLDFFTGGHDVAQYAAEKRVSLETAARELRYGFFRYLVTEGRNAEHAEGNLKVASWGPGLGDPVRVLPRSPLARIATGHTLDDQAETVLMRVIRGSGLTGLAGIYPRIDLENDDGQVRGEIVRPLLAFRRRELKAYLEAMGQPWREDLTNADPWFTRNRVRQLLVPLLEKEFNPAVAQNLAELAEIAGGEQDYWENEIAGWMGTTVHWSEPEWASTNPPSLVQIAAAEKRSEPEALGFNPLAHDHSLGLPSSFPREERLVRDGRPSSGRDLESTIDGVPWLVANASISRRWFLGEPLAVQRRLVKAIGERAGIPLEFKHIEEILRFAESREKSGKELSLPRGWKLRLEQQELLFLTPDLRRRESASDPRSADYEYPLVIPGSIEIGEAGFTIGACRLRPPESRAYNPDQLLNPDALAGPLRVRNWRAGDRFWPAHTKSSKKVKELLQERHVGEPERDLWPVVVSGDEIVWMRGFPTPAKLQPTSAGEAILIQEKRLGEDFTE
jgi:tRNA(Ile)-lysidine synthetase-like protein